MMAVRETSFGTKFRNGWNDFVEAWNEVIDQRLKAAFSDILLYLPWQPMPRRSGRKQQGDNLLYVMQAFSEMLCKLSLAQNLQAVNLPAFDQPPLPRG